MKYAMFIVMDPEPTEGGGAAAPPVEGWFEYMNARGAYVRGIRPQPRDQAKTVRVRGGEALKHNMAYQGRLELRPIHSIGEAGA